MIDKLFLILLCGVPWGHLLFKSLDIWHGQGQFFQIGLLIIFSLSFFEKPNQVKVFNKPLGALILWVGLLTGYLWVLALTKTSKYPVKIILPFFNFLCFVWFYKLSLEYLNEENLKKILKWLSYSFILVLFYCVLQYLKLDEFLNGLLITDELVGTIGNTSHLAGLLAVIQPLFFNRRGLLPLALLWLIIILANSASGVFVGFGVILVWLFLKRRYKLFISGIGVSLLGFGFIYSYIPEFLTSSHRFELWSKVFKTFIAKPITGFGLGSFGAIGYQLSGIESVWRHAHNEFYQVAFELGLIGLVLVLWVIWEYFKNSFKFRHNDTCVTLTTMFAGMCFLSLFSFPIHLWQLSAIGMLAYSGVYVIKNEVICENEIGYKVEGRY